MSCKCNQCERHRRQYKAIEARDVDELITIVEDLETQLMCTSLDLEVANAVFEGTWTGARARLEKALVKAIAYEEANP